MKVTASLAALLVAGGLTIAGVALAAPSDPPAAEAKPAGPPQPWKDMTPAQKGKYMKDVIVPKMKPAFQAFDADEFKKFGCDTCHGKQAKARKFKMPNPDIFALPATPAGFAELKEKKGNWMKFMGGTVKPQMAALLGLPEFDPKKAEAGGFGCAECHTVKKP
jgi:hypothetical protein